MKFSKKQFLAFALGCLRRKGEKRPIFSPTLPTKEELAAIKRGQKTGQISNKLLKKFFPMAYEGASRHGIMKYYFMVHNKIIRRLPRYTKPKLVDWCTVYKATITGKKKRGWTVETAEGKKFVVDNEPYPGITTCGPQKLNKGTKVLIHRMHICSIVDKEVK